MTMRLYTLRFPDNKIDLALLDSISQDIIDGCKQYNYSWDSYYYHNTVNITEHGINIGISQGVFCRETFTSMIRTFFRGKRKNLIGLVWCDEARGVSHEVLSKYFVDFASEFLAKSGVPEVVARTGTKIAKIGNSIVFPITMGDIITRYTSASALILLLRAGSLLVDKSTAHKIGSYDFVMKNIIHSISRATSWYNEARTTIGASTCIWYFLHFFDLHYLVSKKRGGNGHCNGPSTYYSGTRRKIISALSEFNDFSRIELMDKLLKGRKNLLDQFSTDFRDAFRGMLNKLPPKEKKVKGVTL